MSRLRYVYLTSSFMGSGALFRRLVKAAPTAEPIAVVVSRRARLGFPRRIWRNSGVRYLAFLATVGVLYRPLQRLMRLFALRRNDQDHACDIWATCRRLGIELLEVGELSDDTAVHARVGELHCDVLVSVFFDQKLPAKWLALGSLRAVNVHNSLLPRYAGCAPTIAALARGDDHLGVTVHAMDAAFDAGPIIAQEAVDPSGRTTVLALDGAAMARGIDLLADCLDDNRRSMWAASPQNRSERTYQGHPDKKTLQRLRQRGYRLCTLADVIRACWQ